MGLYSEMLSQERLEKNFATAQNILLITCPGCACESLSYSENLPNRALEAGLDMEQSALAIRVVRDRWIEYLNAEGKTVSNLNLAFPCEMYERDRELIRENLEGKDCVAVLSCSSGFVGIRDLLQDCFDGSLVPMMKTSGSFVFRLVDDGSNKNNKVERETARIVRFGEVHQ